LYLTACTVHVCSAKQYILHDMDMFELLQHSDCLNIDSCKTLMHSLVTSRLDYGNALLCNAPQIVVKQLERVQRASARTIYRLHKRDRVSMTSVLHDLHWLPITYRIQYKILTLAYKAFYSGTPIYLAELLHVYTPTRTLRSKCDTATLITPTYSGERTGGRSFSVTAPKLWNSLPSTIRNIKSLDTFKKQLKTYLFRAHYYK